MFEEKEVTTKDSADKSIPRVNVQNLPSKALAYPKGFNITYREYTLGEVYSASNSKLSKVDRFNFYLEGIETSFNKMDLTLPDFMFIALLRKISTVGSERFTITAECKCGKKIISSSMATLDIEFEDIKAPKLPAGIKIGNHDLKFSPLTVGRFIEVIEKDLLKQDMWLMAYQVVNMEPEEAYKIISKAGVTELKKYQRVDQFLHHDTKPVKLKCECGKEKEVDLDVTNDDIHFLPFREPAEIDDDQICFGD